MLNEKLSVPMHVPDPLIYDFDHVMAPLTSLEPQATWALELQGKASGIFYSPHNGGLWIVQSHALAVEMLRDSEHFAADPRFNKMRQFNPVLLPVQADAPDHAEYRKVLGGYFAPGNMRKLEPDIREMLIGYIDAVKPQGKCEFVSEIGEIFPIHVFLRLVGAPARDREELLHYASLFTRSSDLATRNAGTMGLGNYLRKLYAERQDNLGDDILSRIIKSDFKGRPLAEAELLGLGTLLFLGGLDTVKSVLSFVILYLARHPAQYKRLVETPGLIPAAVEELIRVSGVSLPERAATHDFEYEGYQFRKGDRFMFFLPFMSFDPSLNDDPYRVDFDREISQHVVFGAGAHRCVGSHLARIEIRIFLEEWTRHFPTFRLDPDHPPKMGFGAVWTPAEVPIVWDID